MNFDTLDIPDTDELDGKNLTFPPSPVHSSENFFADECANNITSESEASLSPLDIMCKEEDDLEFEALETLSNFRK